LSIGFRILSFLPSCYSSYRALNFYPDGIFTHCSCQPLLDAHLSGLISHSANLTARSRSLTARMNVLEVWRKYDF
jgi:hypothetical protein